MRRVDIIQAIIYIDDVVILPHIEKEAKMNKMTKEEVTKLTPSQLKSKFDTVSSAIRYLTSLGYNRGEVSKLLDIRYQWVRNVLITPIKKEKEVKKLVADVTASDVEASLKQLAAKV